MKTQLILMLVEKPFLIIGMLYILIQLFFVIKYYKGYKYRGDMNFKYLRLLEHTKESSNLLSKLNALLKKQNKDLMETTDYLKNNAQNIGTSIAIELFACKTATELNDYMVQLTGKKIEEYHPLNHYVTLKILEDKIQTIDSDELMRVHEQIISPKEIDAINQINVVIEDNEDYPNNTQQANPSLIKNFQEIKTCNCLKPDPNQSSMCLNCTNPIKN